MSVLPFVTRAEYDTKLYEDINTEPQSPAHLEALEQFKALYDHSYKALSLLQTFYKKTGRWNPSDDEHMRRMVHHATIISANLAGVKNHGQTTGQQEQTEGSAATPDIDGAGSASGHGD